MNIKRHSFKVPNSLIGLAGTPVDEIHDYLKQYGKVSMIVIDDVES